MNLGHIYNDYICDYLSKTNLDFDKLEIEENDEYFLIVHDEKYDICFAFLEWYGNISIYLGPEFVSTVHKDENHKWVVGFKL